MFSNCLAIKLGRPKSNPWETRLQDENKNNFQEMKKRESEEERRKEREIKKEQKSLRREVVHSRRGRFHRFSL